jgi:hypothetical protein
VGKQEIHEHETPPGSFSRLIFLMAANQFCERFLTVPKSVSKKVQHDRDDGRGF